MWEGGIVDAILSRHIGHTNELIYEARPDSELLPFSLHHFALWFLVLSAMLASGAAALCSELAANFVQSRVLHKDEL